MLTKGSLGKWFVVWGCVSVLVSSALAQRNYPPQIPDSEERVYKTVGEVQLRLYVMKPENWKTSDRRPAVLFFFGGGWKGGSPSQFAQQSRHLAQRGVLGIMVDYRVASRHGTKAVDCVKDARDALRWVRSHADELGIDPDRIAAGGGSAGGHIAACLGTISPPGEESISSRPNAMLLFNPACVLAPYQGTSPWSEDRFEEMRERMGVDPQALSPVHHVKPGAPPCIVFHGEADTVVPFATAELYASVMKAAGNRCDLHGFEGEPHGFFNYGRNDNIAFERTMVLVDQFLISLGWFEG